MRRILPFAVLVFFIALVSYHPHNPLDDTPQPREDCPALAEAFDHFFVTEHPCQQFTAGDFMQIPSTWIGGTLAEMKFLPFEGSETDAFTATLKGAAREGQLSFSTPFPTFGKRVVGGFYVTDIGNYCKHLSMMLSSMIRPEYKAIKEPRLVPVSCVHN